MNFEKLFNLVCHMRDSETAGTDYQLGKVKLNPVEQEKVLKHAVQCFMHGVGVPIGEKKAIQAFSGSSDLPELTKDVFNVFDQVPNYDIYWQQAFKTVKLLKGQLSWEIADVTSGIAMVKIPEGGKVVFDGISGAKQIIGVEKYGMGLGVTWEMIQGRKLYQFVDTMEHARGEIYNTWADVHYALLAAAGATNVIAYDATGVNTLEKDIITINTALQAIAEDNKGKGFGDPNQFKYTFYLDPVLEQRAERAFKLTDASGTTMVGQEVMKRSVSRFYTYHSIIPAVKGLLCISGNKIQNAIYLRELGLSRQEIESLNELRTYWTAFGAAIGDVDQVYQVNFS